MTEYRIIEGDCLKILPTLPKATLLFADPPDNLGLKYEGGVSDKQPILNYYLFLVDVIAGALRKNPKAFWLSHYYKYTIPLSSMLLPTMQNRAPDVDLCSDLDIRMFLWRFTFGQHRDTDFGNGFRPILRFSRLGTKWATDNIRVPSARATKYHDKRAAARGRVPDDIWDFPRVCGTFKERRAYHPNQHPEALMERIIRVTCEGEPNPSVIDLFGGTFTTDRVCRRLGIPCTSIEISPFYCEKYLDSLGPQNV
ncbi:site-specific DNA-methyltransferase [Candidatus Pacearchaeota archaeon]|jgi:site-specific DNA-methyltransferase (adenine-specific)|nr:site-specific DNA-methyltransferase [Candidatus Pacearchaeota archaeon]